MGLKTIKNLNGINNDFEPLFDEHQVYALGLLWADGWMMASESVGSRRLGLDVVKEDFIHFKSSLNSLGKLHTIDGVRPNRKLQARSTISNKSLCGWLFDMGFLKNQLFHQLK